MSEADDRYIFLLGAGASREQQYDDFYKVHVSKLNDKVMSAEKLKIMEMDGFGGRHSLSAATLNNQTILFGG